jgi:hypothetical protein
MPDGIASALALIAASAGATAVVLWLGWIAVTAANATLGRQQQSNWPPYDVSDAWTETGAP